MKQLRLFIFFILVTSCVSSQSYTGIDAAVNTSHWNLSFNGSSLNYSSQFGVSGGIPLEFQISKLFNLSTGVRLANKGTTTIVLYYDNIKVDPVLRVYYLEAPILLKGKFGSDKIRFNPIAGISFGYGISGRIDKIIDDGNGMGHIHNQKLDFANDEINRWNVQLHVGAGMSFILSSGNLIYFDVQYLKGISNLSNSTAFQNEDYSVTALGWELSIGYLLQLGKKNNGTKPLNK